MNRCYRSLIAATVVLALAASAAVVAHAQALPRTKPASFSAGVKARLTRAGAYLDARRAFRRLLKDKGLRTRYKAEQSVEDAKEHRAGTVIWALLGGSAVGVALSDPLNPTGWIFGAVGLVLLAASVADVVEVSVLQQRGRESLVNQLDAKHELTYGQRETFWKAGWLRPANQP